MEQEIKTAWKTLIKELNEQFEADFDLNGILFMIGIQELGKGYKKFSKDEKMDIMHIAVCHLLSGYGYYEYVGRDEEGWPHWKRLKKLPSLKADEQEVLMKQAVIEYFRSM